MMIGTCERVRISRHTSTPEIRGNITSSSTSCGLLASNISIASAPSAAVSTRNPSRSSATRSASRYDCSSSTTRISGASAIRRPPGARRRPIGTSVRRCAGTRSRTSSLALRPTSTVTSPPCACATWRTMARPEPGAAGVAAARLIDAVEPFEDPFEIAARDPDAVVGDLEHDMRRRRREAARRSCSPAPSTSPRCRAGS